jgi:translation initiation factor 2A
MSSSKNADALSSSLPPCRVLVRSKLNKLELFTVGSSSEKQATQLLLLENCVMTLPICTAPDGSFTLVHVSGVGVVKCSLPKDATDRSCSGTSNEPTAFFADTVGVQMMDISPSGAYLLTWKRWNAEKSPNNLRVWSTDTGTLLAAFPQKNISRESWPYLQWTTDEKFAMLLVNGTQIRVYTAADIMISSNTHDAEPRFADKLQIPCTKFSLRRQAVGAVKEQVVSKYYLTTFTSKSKDKPATAAVYEYSATAKFVRIATKSLFQAEECVTHWSPGVQPACLLTLQTTVDVSGQSYYGRSQLWLWNAAAAGSEQEMIAVPLPQEGPVQAATWLPDPNKPASFIVIAGNMPAMASQHHGVTGAVTFLFGNNFHRNTISASPHARFICLAGFGNLAGGMGFWDINKKKLIPHSAANVAGTLQAEAVTAHGWSPDSRYFLVSTTAPRMNVDNGARLYKYSGDLVSELPWNNADYQPNLLLEACFVPSLPHIYPDRPQSPVPERPVEESSVSVATAMAASAEKPVGRYVPPAARNRAGGSSLAERLRKEKEGSLQSATKVTNKLVVKTATGKVVPGLTAAAPMKSKSQIKREKLKMKKEQEATTAQGESAPEAEPQKSEEKAPAEQATDPEKRARKLKKILKQIEDLKLISDLNEDQKAKIASEASVRAELELLGL